MRLTLISIIILMGVQLSFGQIGEELLEILEGNNALSEYDLNALMEEMEDSLFELDQGRDSMKYYQAFKAPVRVSLISTYWRNFEAAQGYHKTMNEGGFLGPQYGIRTRFQVRGRDFNIKATAESDPGEVDFRTPDHRSAGIEVKPGGRSFKLIFGDYHLNEGLGLGMGTRPAFRSWKSEPHQQIKRGSGFSLHGGTGENDFLRGGAISFEKGSFKGRLFFSSRDLDATIKDGSEVQKYISGFNSTGLHRTHTEIKKKDVVYEEISGGGLDYVGRFIELGSLISRFSYSENFRLVQAYGWPEPLPEFRYEAYRYSLWGRGLIGPGLLAAEIAMSSTGAHAMEAAWSGFYSQGLAYSIIYENCSQGFFSHNSLVSSSIIKSKGYSRARMNMLFHAWKKWKIIGEIGLSGVVDPVMEADESEIYVNSGLIYDISAVSGEFVVQARPGKLSSTFKIKEGNRDRSFYWQAALGLSSSGIKNLFTNPGTCLSARARYRDPAGKIIIQAGLCLFTGKNGSPPFYSYEPDVLYSMSLPALSGTGSRIFLLLNYNFLKSFSLQLKLSKIDYDDRKEIGTGNDMILSNHRTGLKVQLVYRRNCKL